jgi:hypothetical protein
MPQKAKVSRAARMSPEHNVVGVGLGEKVSGAEGQQTICLRFLVRHKYALDSLAQKNLLPKTIDGLPTDVVEVGTPRGLSPTASIFHPPHGPIGPGCSVSFSPATPADRSAGTVAAIVTDGAAMYLLSANHVLADEGHVPPGTPIFHPGSLDEPAPTRVGQLDRVIPLSSTWPNRVDCALARLDPGVEWTSVIPGMGPPSGVMQPFPKQLVSKFGRTTERQDGQILNLLQDVQVQLRHGIYPMDDQIEVLGLGGDFASDGDSGSLVVDRGTNAAVGIICAQAGSFTYVSPIGEILAALGVSFA